MGPVGPGGRTLCREWSWLFQFLVVLRARVGSGPGGEREVQMLDGRRDARDAGRLPEVRYGSAREEVGRNLEGGTYGEDIPS